MCISGIYDYICSCNEIFLGKDCEIVNYCYDRNCFNYGICNNSYSIYSCICNLGYIGMNCE